MLALFACLMLVMTTWSGIAQPADPACSEAADQVATLDRATLEGAIALADRRLRVTQACTAAAAAQRRGRGPVAGMFVVGSWQDREPWHATERLDDREVGRRSSRSYVRSMRYCR